MENSRERFNAAPDKPEFSPEEQDYIELQQRLSERIGMKDGDGGFKIMGKILRAAVSRDTIPLLRNQWRQEEIDRKIAEAKPALLDAMHEEATKTNKKLDQLTSRVKSAKAGVQAASENYSEALDELEKFQAENLK